MWIRPVLSVGVDVASVTQGRTGKLHKPALCAQEMCAMTIVSKPLFAKTVRRCKQDVWYPGSGTQYD